jgi:hypothetical protein
MVSGTGEGKIKTETKNMTDHQKENALRIADYLGNKLSPEAREAFKRALGEDDVLRLQYVEALMNRAGTGSGGVGAGDVPRKTDSVGTSDITGKTDAGVAGDTTASPAAGGADGLSVPDDTGAVGMGELEEIVRESGIGDSEAPSDIPRPGENAISGESMASGETKASGESMASGETKASGERVISEGSMTSGESLASGESEGSEEEGNSGSTLFGRLWMLVAAVLLLIAAGVYIYMKVGNAGPGVAAAGTDTTVAAGNGSAGAATGSARSGNRADSSSGVAGSANATGAAGATPMADDPAKRGMADSMYTRLYKPYMRGDDPMELRGFYRDYRTGKYSAVVEAGDTSVKGVGARALLVRDYMRLYTGLSDLAMGNARDAVTELEGVVLRTKPGDMLYETAQWYLALAWLKRNDVDAATGVSKALGLARDVAHSYSRYRLAARELIRVLGS